MVFPTISMDDDDDVKKFYSGDVVYKFNEELNRIDIGTVRRRYGGMDFIDDNTQRLENGQIEVSWHHQGGKQICEQSEVHLMNRNIVAGDIVKRVKGGIQTQKGMCMKTTQMATVLISKTNDLVVQHVDTRRLYKSRRFKRGDAVCSGDKVGRVSSAFDRDIIRFMDCGSRVKVPFDPYFNLHHDVRSIFVEGEPCYPLFVGSCIPDHLVDPVWLNKSESMKTDIHQTFVIESEVDAVRVYWALPNGKIESEPFCGDEIEKLNVFHYHADAETTRALEYKMKLEPNSVVDTVSEWLQEKSLMLMPDRVWTKRKVDNDYTLEVGNGATLISKRIKGKWRANPCSVLRHNRRTIPLEVDVEVICMETKITVRWQDGSEEHIPSTELYLCRSLDFHQFFPGDWVELNNSDDNECGVVKRVDFAERTAQVEWSAQFPGSSRSRLEHKQAEHINLAEYSVYDLERVVDFELSEVVYKSTTNGAMLGVVINFLPRNGSVVVQWSDGSTEDCWPGEFWSVPSLDTLMLVPEYNDNLFAHTENGRTGSDKESEKMSDEVDDDDEALVDENEGFCLLDAAPETHKYYSSKFEPKNQRKFAAALQREYKLLKESLPAGVWVRTYEDRTDLLSLMIRGAKDTPYEDGLFMFDIQLCADYPEEPPQVHFISYTDEQLNPNLYVEGKVCVSLLGTWHGQGTEIWTTNSNLLQLIVSIQGLILVAEPYFNEAGYERDRYTQEGQENSRTYNESVILSVLKSMNELLNTSPRQFQSAVLSHFMKNGEKMCQRIEGYCNNERPDYPLLPVSKGLRLSVELHIRRFRKTLTKVREASEPNQLSC